MPYYLHWPDDPPTNGTAYTSKQDAVSVRTETRTITFVADDRDRQSWRDRERGRFDSGAYLEVPWKDHEWYTELRDLHWAHLSVQAPGMVAYTADEQSGCEDRQLRIAPGKYLTRYAANHMSQPLIDSLVAKVKAATGGERYHVTQSPDTIARLYIHGPGSCMDAKHSFSVTKYHPARAYGGGDLAVAYLGTADDCTARAVIWPEKKIQAPVYGDSLLLELLRVDDYRPGEMIGAKLSIHEDRHGNTLCPYVDGADYCYLTKGAIVLCDSQDKEYSCRRTDGHLEEVKFEPEYSCERCETDIIDEPGYCGHCLDTALCCHFCEASCWPDDDDCVTIDGSTSCGCMEADSCVACDSAYFERCGHPPFCASCHKSGWIECDACSDPFNPADSDVEDDGDPDHCPSCQKTVRCDRTEPLPLEA